MDSIEVLKKTLEALEVTVHVTNNKGINWKNVAWNNDTVQILQNEVATQPIDPHCLNQDGSTRILILRQTLENEKLFYRIVDK